DSGVRCSEMAGLRVDDVDLDTGIAYVTGKGSRLRAAPFGTKTALALRRYLRTRKTHAHEASPALWLGQAGPLGHTGIRQMFVRRGCEAGLVALHPHQLRHTFAHSWLAAGGQENALMKLAGWADRSMIDKYAA